MPQNEDAQADGYYAEDTIGADELDLSFLDDDESKDETGTDTVGTTKK